MGGTLKSQRSVGPSPGWADFPRGGRKQLGALRPTWLNPNSSTWLSSGLLKWVGAELACASLQSASQQTLKEHFLGAWPWWSWPPGLTWSQPSPSPSVHTRAVWVFVCSKRKEAPFFSKEKGPFLVCFLNKFILYRLDHYLAGRKCSINIYEVNEPEA